MHMTLITNFNNRLVLLSLTIKDIGLMFFEFQM